MEVDANSSSLFDTIKELVQSKIESLPVAVTNGFEHVSLNQLGLCMFIVENAHEIRRILNSVEDMTK